MAVERHDHVPGVDLQRRLARVLQVDVASLFNDRADELLMRALSAYELAEAASDLEPGGAVLWLMPTAKLAAEVGMGPVLYLSERRRAFVLQDEAVETLRDHYGWQFDVSLESRLHSPSVETAISLKPTRVGAMPPKDNS